MPEPLQSGMFDLFVKTLDKDRETENMVADAPAFMR
jgi:hypothetical protein